MDKPFLIGITGGSGSGKSYFLQKLMACFTSREICVVSQDNYYHPIHVQPLDEKGIPNFDLPHSIDVDSFLQDLELLMAGRSIKKEEYTFNNPARSAAVLEVHPAPVILVEGIFLFYFERLIKVLDLKIFLETKEDIRLSRRLSRDQSERGYGIEEIMYQYDNHVVPSFEKYIAPFRMEADIIIPNNGTPDKGLDLVICYINSINTKSKD